MLGRGEVRRGALRARGKHFPLGDSYGAVSRSHGISRYHPYTRSDLYCRRSFTGGLSWDSISGYPGNDLSLSASYGLGRGEVMRGALPAGDKHFPLSASYGAAGRSHGISGYHPYTWSDLYSRRSFTGGLPRDSISDYSSSDSSANSCLSGEADELHETVPYWRDLYLQPDISTPDFHKMKCVKPLSLFQRLKSETASKRKQLMCVEIGTKYITVAVSVGDEYKLASHLRILPKKLESLDEVLQSFVLHHNIGGIVFGSRQFTKQYELKALEVDSFIEYLSRSGKFKDMMYTHYSGRIPDEEPDITSPDAEEFIRDLFALRTLKRYLFHMDRCDTNQQAYSVSSDSDSTISSEST